MDFSGKNVWVTGAGKGIGYATAPTGAAPMTTPSA